MKYWKLILLCCVGVMSLEGCGPPICNVKGEIRLKNGSTLPAGRVTFTEKGGAQSFWAPISEDGTFAVDKGLAPPPGEYVVTLDGAELPATYDTDPKTGANVLKHAAKPLIDAKKYGDVKSSPLTATIQAGENEISLDVDSLK